jgi:hypothetical protein
VHLSFALESDRCTNNIAEYEAIILGLHKLRALGMTTCIIRTDSKVIAGQIEKEYSAKEPVLMQYLTVVRGLEKQFKGFTLQHVERNKNEEADALAKAVAKGEALPSDVFYHVIGTPPVCNPEGLQITQDAEGHRIVNLIMAEDWCRRFDPGGSLDRRVNCRCVSQPRWVGARRNTRGKTVRGNHGLVLSCAQGGSACSRGLQAFAWERERA